MHAPTAAASSSSQTFADALATIRRAVMARKSRQSFADVVQLARAEFLDPRTVKALKFLDARGEAGRYYSDIAIMARAALRSDPGVIEAIELCWNAIQAARRNLVAAVAEYDAIHHVRPRSSSSTAAAAQQRQQAAEEGRTGATFLGITLAADHVDACNGADTSLTLAAYRTMVRKMYLVSKEMQSDVRIDPHSCLHAILEDWPRDASNDGELTLERFHKCWFEMVDVHTGSVSADDYVDWICTALCKLTTVAPSAHMLPKNWNDIDFEFVVWRTDKALLDSLRRRAHMGAVMEVERMQLDEQAQLHELTISEPGAAPPEPMLYQPTVIRSASAGGRPTMPVVEAPKHPMLARLARQTLFERGRVRWEAAFAREEKNIEVAFEAFAPRARLARQLAAEEAKERSRRRRAPEPPPKVEPPVAAPPRLPSNRLAAWHARPTASQLLGQPPFTMGGPTWQGPAHLPPPPHAARVALPAGHRWHHRRPPKFTVVRSASVAVANTQGGLVVGAHAVTPRLAQGESDSVIAGSRHAGRRRATPPVHRLGAPILSAGPSPWGAACSGGTLTRSRSHPAVVRRAGGGWRPAPRRLLQA